jgi:O-antigen/teichoic acid export membrane protein
MTSLVERNVHVNTRVRSDVAWALSSQVGVAGSQLVLFALIGHNYGSAALGRYGLALAVTTPLFVGLGLSLRVLVVTAELTYTAREYLTISLFGAGVPLAVAVGASFWFTSAKIIILVGCVKALDQMMLAAVGILQRCGRLNLGSIGLLTNGAVTCLAVLAASRMHTGLSMFIVASAVGSAAGLTVACASIRRSESLHLPKQSAGMRRNWFSVFVKGGVAVGASAALLSLITGMPAIVLSHTVGLGQVAAFTALSYMRTTANLVFASVSQALLRPLTISYRQSRKSFQRWLAISSLALGSFGVVIGLILFVLGPTIIPMIFNVYLEHPYLNLAALAVTLGSAGVIYALDAALSAARRFHVQFLSALMALGVVTAAVVPLVRAYGLVGATLSLTLGMVTVMTCKFMYYRLKLAG